MTPKDPEMVIMRVRVARDLEATFDTYLEPAVTGYDAFLAPALAEGETLPDSRQHLVLLKRRVVQYREELETLSGDIVGELNGNGQLILNLNTTIDNVLGKMRDVRYSCHGLFGPEFVELTGLKGVLPRTGDRLYSKGRVVQTSLKSSNLVLKPKILFAVEGAVEGGEAKSLRPADLARHLEPDLSVLGTIVGSRFHGNRGIQDLRTLRRLAARSFDNNIRGIVRIASGIMRVSGRLDAATRFRATLRPLSHRASTSSPSTPPPTLPSTSSEPSVDSTP